MALKVTSELIVSLLYLRNKYKCSISLFLFLLQDCKHTHVWPEKWKQIQGKPMHCNNCNVSLPPARLPSLTFSASFSPLPCVSTLNIDWAEKVTRHSEWLTYWFTHTGVTSQSQVVRQRQQLALHLKTRQWKPKKLQVVFLSISLLLWLRYFTHASQLMWRWQGLQRF